MPGSSMVTDLVTSLTRTGEMTRCGSSIAPSGPMSYSLAKTTSCPAGPADWVSAAGESSCTVSRPEPTTSTAVVSGAVANRIAVPGGSVTGWDWSSADVSV